MTTIDRTRNLDDGAPAARRGARPLALLAAALLAVGLGPAAPARALDVGFAGAFDFGSDTLALPGEAGAPVRLAQAGGDPFARIDQLQEEVRSLNGRIEDLSFQILQLQEQLRKQQEDNEFRFQELEGGSASQPSSDSRTDAAPPAAGSGDEEFAAAPSATAPNADDPIADVLENGLDVDAVGSTTAGAAAAPSAPPPAPSQTVAAITPGGAGDLYNLAYNYLLAGDYELAEQAFSQYAQTYPTAADAPDAQYWLGESQFAQGDYADAAETFLNAQKSHPDSAKAPEMMLKLGMALAKLDNRDTACVTFNEVSRRYPGISASVERKLAAEKAASRCS